MMRPTHHQIHRTVRHLHAYHGTRHQRPIQRLIHTNTPITQITAPSPPRKIHPHQSRTLSSSPGIISKVRNFFRVIFGSNEISPRGLQERKDSYYVLLALECRRLRLECQQQPPQQTKWQIESREQVKSFLDRAADNLDQDSIGIHDLLLGKLRKEVQRRLEPQILDRLLVASMAEEAFGDEDEYVFDQGRVEEYKDILWRDYEQVCDKLKDWEMNELNEEQVSSRGEFYKLKKSGIERLLNYYDWWPENQQPTASVELTSEEEDEFGFNSTKSTPEIIPAMRYHHVKNLIRSHYAQQSTQFSILPLKSTIPNAGRGVYISGYAPAGTLLAFFPGKVYPKDYLMQASLQTQVNLSNDPRHQLSMRYDDILLDCRRSPYTVYENLWALGHVINHPVPPPAKDDESKDEQDDNKAMKQLRIGPNCVTVPIDYTKSMLEQSPNLQTYIPNSYEVEPKPWAKNAFDSDNIVMNGMGIIARRDVCDEELFYDYRMSGDEGGGYPDWYYVWDEDALINRWSHDDK